MDLTNSNVMLESTVRRTSRFTFWLCIRAHPCSINCISSCRNRVVNEQSRSSSARLKLSSSKSQVAHQQRAGLQSSKEIKSAKEIDIPKTKRTDAPTETTSSNKKRRKTQKMMYAFYNCVALFFGLRKKKAMKRVKRKRKLTKDVKETTFTEVLRELGITEWPRVVKNGTKASTSSPKTQDNPMASKIPTGLELAENAHLKHNTNERQLRRDNDVMKNQYNDVWITKPKHTENQLVPDSVGSQVGETLDMAISDETPIPITNVLEHEVSAPPDTSFVPQFDELEFDVDYFNNNEVSTNFDDGIFVDFWNFDHDDIIDKSYGLSSRRTSARSING